MASVTYGTGKRLNCTRNGRLMTVYVLACCGTHMNQVNLLLQAGTVLSSTGTKVVISFKKGRSEFFCKYSNLYLTLIVIRVMRLKKTILCKCKCTVYCCSVTDLTISFYSCRPLLPGVRRNKLCHC